MPVSACGVQVWPPLLVARMVPFSPTAHPWFWSANVTPKSVTFTPDVWACQVLPSVVATIVPFHPTAQACVESSAAPPLSW